MDQGNEIFSNDYAALREKLTYYPGISIISVDKEPPEQYVIEYKLFGYGYDASNQIQMLRRHRIEINLPFGYPHFPPTVKPLTRLCHPDAAEHAIRIADYWQTNQSLADLVIHIGDMIRGAVYNTEGVFNEEAARWYADNRQKLPLAELEYRDPYAKPEKPAAVARTFSQKHIAGVLLAALVLGSGGLVVREKMILASSGKHLQQMRDSMESRRFGEAGEIGRETVDALRSVFLFGSQRDVHLGEVTGLLESDTLQEGLAGRVEHQGRYVPFQVADTLVEVERLQAEAAARLAGGDVGAAGAIYSTAVQLAEKNGLKEAAEGVRRESAEKRLMYFVEKANAAYGERRWQQAADLYGQAVDILRSEKDHLSADSVENLEKLEKLKMLAMANIYREEAGQAEKKKNYRAAADRYRGIVTLIERSDYGVDPVMAKVVSDAEKERQRMTEQALVTEGTEYLLENFKEIFMEHYPGLFEPGLQSPRVRYLGRNDGNLLFIMSCIELVQRTSNEFRLYYQFDPDKRDWSIYRDEK